ncbi:MAG: TIR domain-containing protein, partial [Clostridia bacterium]|nr:TIR domain-containing protein [Clostridia bacterium]
MALFKCKMCGGELDISEGMTVAECEYCGTKQTVPKAMDENLQNLFNRANSLRIKSEFDKAEKIYERIIHIDTTQSEAYWGLILCKYGIEYVDDPATYKRIPTCHRVSYDSVVADDDYKSAIENADMSQRAIYEEQAKEIDRIQKEILEIAQNEETYDVFICYKETDAYGQRTQDSVIANDIYYQLTNEGFKVFYAAITLEGKLGSAYEPIIFAALNSAKVMLSIGTKPEYFNAVWVKNEWSRFLKIIKHDRSKILIPCYRDMDAYELPEEFAHLQAQDMSKIGFINDVVRGIKKVIEKDIPKADTAANETVAQNSSVDNIPNLIKRAFIFLEQGEFDSANNYFDRVLDLNPEHGDAYLGKLLASLNLKNKEALKNCSAKISKNPNYTMALRFANAETSEFLNKCVEQAKERRARNKKEKRIVIGVYSALVASFASTLVLFIIGLVEGYNEVASVFAFTNYVFLAVNVWIFSIFRRYFAPAKGKEALQASKMIRVCHLITLITTCVTHILMLLFLLMPDLGFIYDACGFLPVVAYLVIISFILNTALIFAYLVAIYKKRKLYRLVRIGAGVITAGVTVCMVVLFFIFPLRYDLTSDGTSYTFEGSRIAISGE